MLFSCLIIFVGDFLLISAIWEEAYEALRRGRGACYHVPFPCVEIFIYVGYEKLVSWLMLWVLLKAFALSPRPTEKSFSGSFPALPIPGRLRRATVRGLTPVTQVPSAHLPRQEYKGGGWPGFWEGDWARRNQQQKAEGCNKLVSCCSCDKQSSQCAFSKAGGFSVDFG